MGSLIKWCIMSKFTQNTMYVYCAIWKASILSFPIIVLKLKVGWGQFSCEVAKWHLQERNAGSVFLDSQISGPLFCNFEPQIFNGCSSHWGDAILKTSKSEHLTQVYCSSSNSPILKSEVSHLCDTLSKFLLTASSGTALLLWCHSASECFKSTRISWPFGQQRAVAFQGKIVDQLLPS